MEQRSIIAQWGSNFTLRQYQRDAVEAALQAANDDGLRSIITLPTGTGKSICIAELAHIARRLYPHLQVLVLHHNAELILQNEATFTSLLKSPYRTGIASSKLGEKEWRADVVFASINTAYKHPLRFRNVSCILIDECHLVGEKENTMFRSFLAAVWAVNPMCRVVGFSATPYRLGLGSLEKGSVFNNVAFDGCSTSGWKWFLDEGWLCWLHPKRTDVEMDVSGLKTSAGDFQTGQMDDRYSRDEAATVAAVKESIHLAGNRRKWLVFCTGVKHAERTAEILCQHGRRAAAVHSKLTTEEQTARIKAYRRGELDALVNMNMLTTGFDVRDIDCIVMLRPTKSPGLWVQMLGRGTRPLYAPGYPLETSQQRLAAISASPKQNCLVLDFARNTERLGPINDPHIPEPGPKRKTGQAPQKICEHKDNYGFACNTYNPIAATHCLGCCTPFPEGESKLREHASHLALITVGEEAPVKVAKAKPVYWVEYPRPGAPIVASEVTRPVHKLQIIYPTNRGNRYTAFDPNENWHRKLWVHLTKTPAPPTVEAAAAVFHDTPPPLALVVKKNHAGKIYPSKAIFDAVALEQCLREYGDKPK